MTLRTFLYDVYVDFAASLIALGVVAFHWEDAPFHGAGIILAIVCLALWFKARLDLGNSFSVLPRANHLVTNGLYSRIGHPIYLFSTLFVFALALASNQRLIFMLAAVIAVGQFVRARLEQIALEKKFPDEYKRYRDSTWL